MIALSACAPTPQETETATSVAPSVRDASASPGERVEASPSAEADAFPIAAFADISEGSVPDDLAAEFQAALEEMAGDGGMSATVMSPDGTWSGAAGKADGVRKVTVDDQFGIASITKSITAAQVMQMVEAGELGLDDPVADYLPPDLDFDTNGATIRQLLGHVSGIPDWFDAKMQKDVATDRRRVWTTAEVLELVDDRRTPAGSGFEYADTNYNLLGLAIEQVRGRPVAEVLRDGVLDVVGTERLVYQPDEAPTEPMAMPLGESKAAIRKGGGFLPSISDASSAGPAGAIASDSPSLARWWRALCAGDIVSQDSLNQMSTMVDGYGLGLHDYDYPGAVGHTGGNFGYSTWAGCLPEDGTVVVVLTNQLVDNIGGMAQPLVNAVVAASLA
ncbi:MAG TPA: serine hydrolase domain-containing protein [Actinomycetota bacterium]|nr:serine hydrolase domain-containing protein [Actinomycetota bacterium]